MDNLLVIDVQPEYHQYCHHMVPKLIRKLNETHQRVIYYYVDFKDTEEDVVAYLLENGLDEDALDKIEFHPKSYGFFRDWMDEGVNKDDIVSAIKVMREEKVPHSDMCSLHQEWCDEISSGLIYIEDFPPLNENDSFEVVGGGLGECLSEMIIYLEAHDKDYALNPHLTYGNMTNVYDFKLVGESKRLGR